MLTPFYSFFLDFNRAMDARDELEEVFSKLKSEPLKYELMGKATEMLQGVYSASREFMKSELGKAYESSVVEEELIKLKKTPLEKAKKLLGKKCEDLLEMSLEEIILYTAKVKKVTKKLKGLLSVRYDPRIDWELTAKKLPGMELNTRNKAWDFKKELDVVVVPKFELVEGEKVREKLCKDPFFCKLNEVNDERHQREYLHVCKYGIFCKDLSNPKHLKKYVHLRKPRCENYKCTDDSSVHRVSYAHQDKWDFLLPCRYENSCRDLNNSEHLKKYTHEQPCFPCIKAKHDKSSFVDNSNFDDEDD